MTFQEYGQAIQDKLMEEARNSVDKVIGGALRTRAPKDTGLLRRSITVERYEPENPEPNIESIAIYAADPLAGQRVRGRNRLKGRPGVYAFVNPKVRNRIKTIIDSVKYNVATDFNNRRFV